jgi:HSP20 family molecular chaperone IbpA
MRDNYMRTANTNGLMQTDVEEHENAYEITMNLPGFKKEDVKGEIKDGYLTITASTNTNNDEKDKDGKFIRRERYSGTCSRSFYVGEDVTQDEIKAKFVDGVLKVAIPKKEAKPQVEKSNFISIEG